MKKKFIALLLIAVMLLTQGVSATMTIKAENENMLGLWTHGGGYVYFGKDGFCRQYSMDENNMLTSYNGTYTINDDLITISSDYGYDWFTYEIHENDISLIVLKSGEKLEDGSWWLWYAIDKISTPDLQENIFDGEDLTTQMQQIYEYNESGLYLEIIDMCSDLLDNHIISIDDRVQLLRKREDAEGNYRKYVFNSALQQIEDYNSRGMYLEIMDICDHLSDEYSPAVTSHYNIARLRKNAEYSYNEYLKEEAKWGNYKLDGNWRVSFKALKSCKPYAHGDGGYQFLQVYSGDDNDWLGVRRYRIGSTQLDGYKVLTVDGLLSHLINNTKQSMVPYNIFPGGDFWLLSSNGTTVGSIAAKQATARTKMHDPNDPYTITRYIVFQHGDWIYNIESQQDRYEWSDDFYNLMETVRTSLYFY